MASVKLILHGHYKGKTVKLRDVQFVNGEAVLPGTYAQLEGLIKYLGRSFQAYPEGLSPEEGSKYASEVPASAIGNPPKEIPGAGESSGSGPASKGSTLSVINGGAQGGSSGGVSPGNGHEDPRLHTRLIGALNSLDPRNDEHWTRNGQPAIAAVEAALGGGQVTRKEIEAAIPGFNRELAAGASPEPQGEGAGATEQ